MPATFIMSADATRDQNTNMYEVVSKVAATRPVTSPNTRRPMRAVHQIATMPESALGNRKAISSSVPVTEATTSIAQYDNSGLPK